MPIPLKTTDKNTTAEQFDALFQEGILVECAFLHQVVVAPGAINSEKTLNKEKISGITMSYHPQGNLLIKVKSKGGKDMRIFVPSSNVANAII